MSATVPAPADQSTTEQPHGKLRSGWWMVAALVVMSVATALGLVWTGAAQPQVVWDPGAGIRWGLPLLNAIATLSYALCLGSLMLAATALPVTVDVFRRRRLAYRPALTLAGFAGASWALSSLALLIGTSISISATTLSAPDFGDQLLRFSTGIDLGRTWTAQLVLAVLITTACAGVVTVRSTGLLVVAALGGSIPMSLRGHASGSADHETAVTAMGMHVISISTWVGGVLVIALMWPGLANARRRGIVIRRFAPIALVSVILVGVSGVVNAALRLSSVADLGTRYGVLVVVKVVAFVVLVVIGWRHRRANITAVAQGRSRAFLRWIASEVVVMAFTWGISVALTASPAPVPDRPDRLSLTQSITGYPMPTEPTAASWLMTWHFDLLWVVLAVAAIGWYAVAVIRLRRRGDAWPWLRLVLWIAGWMIVIWATCGAPAVYGRVLFSAHMIGHMVISMAAPLTLVLAAPVTLALRTLSARRDGSWGPREWVQAVVHGRYVAFLCHPVVVGFLFAGSLVIFYYSPLFELALTTHVGHEFMYVHFLLVGYLFAWAIVGVDPGPRRPIPALRLVMLLVTMAFHAFFGVVLMTQSTVLAAPYFTSLERPWGPTPLSDQQAGGALMWALGEFPTLVMAVIAAIQWSRSDEREARRSDRAADRNGDAELKAYNTMLADLADRDAAPR